MLTFAVIAIVAFLTTIDNTIVNVALPTIQRSLSMSLPALEWVATGYIVTFAALMLAGGRLADRYGKRTLLLLGLAVFTMASLLAGAATDAAMLLSARAVQGAGAALTLPAALAIATSGPSARDRDRGAAVWMVALAAALAIGPLAGGWLSQHLGWRWIFFVNLPPGLLGLLVGWRVRDSGRRDGTSVGMAGLFCSAVVLASVTFVLTEGPETGWRSWPIAAVVVAGACGAVGLVAAPVVDLGLLRKRAVWGGVAASVLWGTGVNGVFFFTSLFLQRDAGFSASGTGLVFLPIAAAVVVFAPVAAPLAARIGTSRTVAGGLLLVAVGLVAVSLVRYHVTLSRLLPGVTLIGIGSALTVPLTPSVLAAVPASVTGTASALLSVAREASGLAGISLIGLIVTAGHGSLGHGGAGPGGLPGGLGPGGLAGGYGRGLLAAAGCAVLGAFVVSRTLPAHAPSTDPSPSDPAARSIPTPTPGPGPTLGPAPPGSAPALAPAPPGSRPAPGPRPAAAPGLAAAPAPARAPRPEISP